MKIVRWRYVLFEVISGDVGQEELISIIWRQIYSLFGVFKGANSGFKLLQFDKDKKIGIARINWRFIDEFRVVLATLNMQKEGLLVNEILVSGTLAALKRKMMERKTWRELNKDIMENEKLSMEVNKHDGDL